MTLFETVKSFADVLLTDQGVETSSFLEASDGLVKMFDLLGSPVFQFVKVDLRGNIAGVRARYESAGSTSNTLEGLLESERLESQNHATGCLVRLIRGLSLTCKALRLMREDPNTELYTCFQLSYDQVLRHHHSWVVNSLAYLAIRSTPHRRDFYTQLSQGGDVQKFDSELAKWLAALHEIVERMSKFLEQGNFGRV